VAFRGTGSWMLVAWSICLAALLGPPEAMAAVAEPKEYGTAIAFSFEDYRSMPRGAGSCAGGPVGAVSRRHRRVAHH
jgi:hypothetical protein